MDFLTSVLRINFISSNSRDFIPDLTSWKIWCVICLSLIEISSSSLLLTSFRDMWNSLEPPNLLLRSMGITILKNGYFEDFDFCSVMYFCIVLLPKVEVTTQKGSVNFRNGRPENWKYLVISTRCRLRYSMTGRGGESNDYLFYHDQSDKKTSTKS